MDQAVFGTRLRELRIAAGLSQEALAERARISSDAISALERGARRFPQRQTMDLLAAALGLTLEQRGALEAAAERRSAPRRRAPAIRAGAPGNLPALRTSFLGRDGAVADIRLRLEAFRLVTLAGPGGVGKTRAALETARASMDQFPDGVWFVELASLRDPALVMPRIVQTLGLRERPGESLAGVIAAHVGERRVLLVLDNCEHVAAAATAAADALLRATPHLRLLATARAPLAHADESVYRLPPLPVPNAASLPDPDVVRASPAVRLFVDRAATALPAFEPRGDWMSIATICSRLDGLPLAIELAAARANVMTPRDIAQRLGATASFLRGTSPDERHLTLDAMIGWSDALLAPDERRLFHQLGIFAGRFTLEAVAAVCGGDDELALLDRLASLIDKSLLVAEDAGAQRRFRLLEPVRAYVVANSEERESLAAAHAAYVVTLVQRYADDVSDAMTTASRHDLDDVRAALTWTLAQGNDRELGVHLAGIASPLWLRHELWTEGLGWLSLAAEHARDERAAARVWHGISVHHNRMNRHADALAAAKRAVDFARASGAEERIASSTIMLAHFLHRAGEVGPAEAIALLDEGRGAAARMGRDDVVASANINRGLMFDALGDTAAAEDATLEALGYYRSIRSARAEAICLQNLACFAANGGDMAHARTLAHEAIRTLDGAPNRIIRATTLVMAAWFSLACGRPDDADREFADARATFRAEGGEQWLDEGAEFAALRAAVNGKRDDALRAIGYFRARTERQKNNDVPRYALDGLASIVDEATAAEGAAAVARFLNEGRAMSRDRFLTRFDAPPHVILSAGSQSEP